MAAIASALIIPAIQSTFVTGSFLYRALVIGARFSDRAAGAVGARKVSKPRTNPETNLGRGGGSAFSSTMTPVRRSNLMT